MTADVKLVIEQADKLLSEGALEAAEENYSLAFRSCLAADEEIRSEALWALIKLAGKFIALGINDRPEELYRYVKVARGLERSFVFERLAIFQRQKGNAEKAEEFYLAAFESKGQVLGFEHPDTQAAMQRATQYLQAQNKSPDVLQEIILALSQRKEEAAAQVIVDRTEKDAKPVDPKTNERNRPTGGFRVIKPPPPKTPIAPAVPIARGVRTQTAQHKIPIPGKIPLSGPAKGASPNKFVAEKQPVEEFTPSAAPAEVLPVEQSTATVAERTMSAPAEEANSNIVIETIQNILSGQTPSPDFHVRDEDLRLFAAELPLPEEPDLDRILLMEDVELDQTVSGAFILPMVVNKPKGEQPPPPPAELSQKSIVKEKEAEPPRTISSADRDSILAAWEECVACLQERNSEHAKRSTANNLLNELIGEIAALLQDSLKVVESSLEKGLAADEWSQQTDEIDWQIIDKLANLYSAEVEADSDQLSYEIALTFSAMLRAVKLGPCHADTAMSLHRLGYLLCTGAGSTKYLRGAIAVLKLSWLLHHSIYGTNDRSTVINIKSLAMAYAAAQRPEADLFFRRALALVESTLDFGETDMLELWSRYARFCQDRGNYRRAAEAYTSQLSLYESCGHDPESLAETYLELVLCFDKLKIPDLAEQYHDRLCDLAERLLYPDYKREVFASRYEESGQHARAEQLYKQILHRSSVPASLDNARAKLIQLYESTGRSELAAKIKSPVEELEGERPHPAEVDQADLCVSYGRSACRAGQLDESKAFFMRAYSLRSLSTGVSPAVALELARGLRELVEAYEKKRDYQAAADCCAVALKMAETHVGAEHVETATCHFALGLLESRLHGNPGTHLSQSYEIRRKLLGREHLDTADSAFEVAIRLSGQDLWRDKEDLFKLAICARQRAFGLCEMRSTMYLRVLTEHYAERGDFRGLGAFKTPQFHKVVDSISNVSSDKASTFLKLALNKGQVREDLPAGLSTREKLQFLSARLDDRKFRLGPNHPDTLNSLFKIVEIYENSLETDDDAIWKDLPAVDHLNIALNLRLFGHHFLPDDDLPRCHRLFSTVLTLTEHVLGTEHPDSALCLFDLATLSARRKEYQLSEILFSKSIEVMEARLGSDHLYPAAANNNLAVVYHRQGKFDMAEPLYRKALQTVLLKTRGDSTEKQVCMTNLELLKENVRP